jgi:hypothetical protein
MAGFISLFFGKNDNRVIFVYVANEDFEKHAKLWK